MGAIGHDASVFKQDDAIGQADGREPVGDDERRAPFHEDAQGVVDLLFHLHVDGTGGVVEDEDGRVDEQRSSNRDALALTARERVAPFADDGVVPVRKLRDELVCPAARAAAFTSAISAPGRP